MTKPGNEFVTATEGDWYWWAAMPGQGLAGDAPVTASYALKSPEAADRSGQAGAADNYPVTAVKGLAAEKSPAQGHVTAPAPTLGTVIHAELECMTVLAAVTVTVTVSVTVNVNASEHC